MKRPTRSTTATAATHARGALAALLCACASTGCASAPAPATGLEVVESREPTGSTVLAAEDLEPQRPRTERWCDADDPRRTWTVRVEATHEGAARTDDRGTRVTVRGPDGGIGLLRQTDATDAAESRFTPPLSLAPARLAPGEEHRGESTVHAVTNGIGDRDPGNAMRTARIAALDRVRTPLGTFEAVRVDALLVMKLPHASLRRETSTWVRPGTGPVAVRSDERILVMGVFPRNRAATAVMVPGGTP